MKRFLNCYLHVMSYSQNVKGQKGVDKGVLKHFYRSETFKGLPKEIRDQILNSDKKTFEMFLKLFKAEIEAAEKLRKAFESRNAEILNFCNEEAKKIYLKYVKEKEENLNKAEEDQSEKMINQLLNS